MEMSRQKLQTFLQDHAADHIGEDLDVQQTKHQEHLGSSPSHEFSFSISFHGAKSAPPVGQFPHEDLSPADDLFFHGHLLPLHLLRRPDNNQTLPVVVSEFEKQAETGIKDGRSISKSFSMFGTWISKRCNEKDQIKDDCKKDTKKKKWKLDAVKKYMRMIKLKTGFSSFRRRGVNDSDEQDQLCSSYSGNFGVTGHENPTKRWELSAPASMGTSPANSGVFMDSGTITPTTTMAGKKSDSTMEELQAAIQAAIAHCKNSNKDDEEEDDDNYIKLFP